MGRLSLALLLALALLAPLVAGDCRTSCTGTGCHSAPQLPTGGSFPGSDYRHSCLVDASRTCANTANKKCCSCGIYTRFCGQGGSFFVTNGNSLLSPNHLLVLPNNACPGVEVWPSKNCGGENIWDQAVARMTAQDGSQGAAVNSVGRRGMHQLHVHVGKLWNTLAKALPRTPGNTVQISCNKVSSTNLKCFVGTGGTYRLTATAVSASAPRRAKAFAQTYGNPPDQRAVTTTLMLVPLSATTFVLVTTQDAPAECLLRGQDLQCY